MNMKNENNDRQPNEQFSKDLSSLFEPQTPVSGRVDRAVMDAAAKRLRHRGKGRRFAYGAACAAAAMIVVGVLFFNMNQSADNLAQVALQKDVNRDGAVDILDAFKLARHIESAESPKQGWDMNGDGVVDQKDVDTVAMVAVNMKEGAL